MASTKESVTRAHEARPGRHESDGQQSAARPLETVMRAPDKPLPHGDDYRCK